MSLLTSFIFSADYFLCWIDKSALALAGVSIGPKPSYLSPFLFTIYWTVLSASKSFPEKSHITLYLFSKSSKHSTISSVHWNFPLFSLLVSVSLSFVFLLFAWRSHEVLAIHQNFHTLSRHVACCSLLLTCMSHSKKLHRQGGLSHLGRFILVERRNSPLDTISATRYIAFWKKFIG